jgi:four helix bundle protein
MGIQSYEDLNVWKSATTVTLATYQWTRGFPSDEKFGLSLQMRRAAVSVHANIAEGFARRMPRDKARLYNIAEGSAEELGGLARVASLLGYGGEPASLREAIKSTSKMLRRLTDVTLARAFPSPGEG